MLFGACLAYDVPAARERVPFALFVVKLEETDSTFVELASQPPILLLRLSALLHGFLPGRLRGKVGSGIGETRLRAERHPDSFACSSAIGKMRYAPAYAGATLRFAST